MIKKEKSRPLNKYLSHNRVMVWIIRDKKNKENFTSS